MSSVAVARDAPPGREPILLRFDLGKSPAAWELTVAKGSPDVEIGSEGAMKILSLRSSRSSFGVQRKVELELGLRPILSWRWRADELPRGGDFRRARTNDQAAQLYVAFSPTRAIGYIWDSSAPEGATGKAAVAPPFLDLRIVVLRSGEREAGLWRAERRDLAEDYLRLFGEEMPAVRAVGIRLWINSQHTESAAASAFADLAFEARGPSSRAVR